MPAAVAGGVRGRDAQPQSVARKPRGGACDADRHRGMGAAVQAHRPVPVGGVPGPQREHRAAPAGLGGRAGHGQRDHESAVAAQHPRAAHGGQQGAGVPGDLGDRDRRRARPRARRRCLGRRRGGGGRARERRRVHVLDPVDDIERERVGPGAVRARAPLHAVGRPVARGDAVVAVAAVDAVAPGAGVEHVVAGAAAERVDLVATGQRVVPVTAVGADLRTGRPGRDRERVLPAAAGERDRLGPGVVRRDEREGDRDEVGALECGHAVVEEVRGRVITPWSPDR